MGYADAHPTYVFLLVPGGTFAHFSEGYQPRRGFTHSFPHSRDTGMTDGIGARAPMLAGRKPRLLLLLDGVLLLRFAERQFSALLFQLPPRLTRFEPLLRLPSC